MPRRFLDLLMAPLLATALALAVAAPVRADDDDRDDVECPCWTKSQGRRLVDAALDVTSGNDWTCDSDIDVRATEKSAGADFVVVGVEGRELDLEASLLIDDGDVLRASCSVEVFDEIVVREDALSAAEALECVEILGKICLKNLPATPETPEEEDDDDDDDDDDDERSSKQKRNKGNGRGKNHDDD